jgi:hypothetical protein
MFCSTFRKMEQNRGQQFYRKKVTFFRFFSTSIRPDSPFLVAEKGMGDR